MIRDHDFNSEWWGARVGFVESGDFFALPPHERQRLLAPYAWAEFRSPLEEMPSPWNIERAGFVQVDTQIEFRIDLRKVQPLDCSAGLAAHSAEESAWDLSLQSAATFQFERFAWLAGSTPERIADRYLRWAKLMVARAPQWCLQIQKDHEAEGWFLSEPGSRGLNLALALNSSRPSLSGALVYQLGLVEYARRGAAIGYASFSIRNTPVHRIYSHLGAVFTPPTGCWLWQKETP
jgi:hypothetical protein